MENARRFVRELLEEGSKVPCDDTNEKFNNNFGNLPDFYDEEKYNRLVFGLFIRRNVKCFVIRRVGNVMM